MATAYLPSLRRVRVALADDSAKGKRIAITRPGYTAPSDTAASSPTTGQRPRTTMSPAKTNN